MSVSRLEHIAKIGVEQMGDLADRLADPSVLRLENLDTDLRPPQSALDFTRRAIEDDAANSYLPFFGLDSMRQAATALVGLTIGTRVRLEDRMRDQRGRTVRDSECAAGDLGTW